MAAPMMAATDVAPSRFRIWFQAVRFFSFTASVIPIAAGSALALVERQFDPLLFVLMVIAGVATHAGCNLANDYFDHRKGIDTEESLGPSKVIQRGLLSPAEVRRGFIVAFAIATALGLVIVAETGWPVLALALASLAAAYLYTGGPKPLGYIALGELTVFVFMGLGMVMGAYYVMTGALTWTSLLVATPIAAIVAAILHANNIRDIPDDAAAGKVTLATLLGRRGANIEFAILTYGAYVAVAATIVVDPRLWPIAITAVTIPVAVRVNRLAFSPAMRAELNPLVRKTAGLHLRFGGFLTLGLVASAVIERF